MFLLPPFVMCLHCYIRWMFSRGLDEATLGVSFKKKKRYKFADLSADSDRMSVIEWVLKDLDQTNQIWVLIFNYSLKAFNKYLLFSVHVGVLYFFLAKN